MTQISRHIFYYYYTWNYYIKKTGSEHEHVVTLSRTYGTWVKMFAIVVIKCLLEKSEAHVRKRLINSLTSNVSLSTLKCSFH